MDASKILISGASGLIGAALYDFLKAEGNKVHRLVRSKDRLQEDSVYWDPKGGAFDKQSFENFDAIIHLAGENIARGRWTKSKKDALFQSRCRDTWLLSQTLTRLNNPPKTLLCASAVGYYGDRGEEQLTEESLPGKNYLADLCAQWERAASAASSSGIRVVNTRFGVVLSNKGGALKMMLGPFKWGLGGKLGSGKQIMPWIHIEDVVGAIQHCLTHSEISGPVNVVAPNPVTQAEFAKTLASILHRPAFMNIPAWALRLVLGQMADEALLASVNAQPEKLLRSNYKFRYSFLKETLNSLIINNLKIVK